MEGRVSGPFATFDPIAGVFDAGLIAVLVLVLFLIAALIIQPLLALSCAAVLGPQRLDVLARTAASRGLVSFCVGAGLLTAFFLLSLAGVFIPLWIPGIGLPLSLILFVPLVVGYAGISYWVGHGLLPQVSAMLAAFLGAVLVTIIQMIPIVGWIAGMIFSDGPGRAGHQRLRDRSGMDGQPLEPQHRGALNSPPAFWRRRLSAINRLLHQCGRAIRLTMGESLRKASIHRRQKRTSFAATYTLPAINGVQLRAGAEEA